MNPGPRLAWWALAASIDLVATWSAHPLPDAGCFEREISCCAE